MLSLSSERRATLNTFFAWKRTPKVTTLDAQLLTLIGHPTSPICQLDKSLLMIILNFLLAPSPEEYNTMLASPQLSIVMRISREISKATVLDYFLSQLHGCYSLCHQAYTDDPDDAVQYTSNYKEARQYLGFIEKHYSHWIIASATEKDLQEKYSNYLDAAQDYLENECPPPHPTSSLRAKFPQLFHDASAHNATRDTLTRRHSILNLM